MSDIRQLQEEFDRLKARVCVIAIQGVPLEVPEGYVAEISQGNNGGFRVSMIRLTVRELALAAEKRVEHVVRWHDPLGNLVASQYIDTGWEASGPALGGKVGLPGDYRVIR